MAASTGPSSLVSLRPCEEGGLPSGRAMACRAFFPALSRSRPCLSAETSGPSFSSSAPSWWNGRGPAPKTVAMAFSDPDVYQIPYVEGMPVGKKLKLWNLPPNCPREDLLEWFHAVNVTVDSLEFTDDPVLNAQGIGAFVEFGTKQDACVAIIRLDGYKLKGRSIRMDFVEKRPYSKEYGRRNRNKSWASDTQSHAVPRSNIEVRPSMAGAVAHTSDVEGPKNDSGYGSSQPGAGPSYGTIQANNATSLTNSEAQTFAVNDELHPSHSNRGYGTSHHAEDSSYGSTYSSATGKGYMKSTSDIDVRTIYHDNTDGHSGYNSYPPGPTYGTTSFTDNRERVGNESHGYEQSVPTQGNSIAPNHPMDSAAGLDYAANRSNHHSLPIYGNGINTLQAAPGNAPGYSEAGVRNASSYGNSQPVTGFGNGTQFVPTYSPTRLGNHSQFAQSSHIGPQYGSQQGYDMGSFRASRSNRLFVGNLAWIVDENRLQQLFSQYGTVLEARVIKDRDSGRSRGFGFVSMLTADELQAAIEALDGLELEGRLLKVNVAASRS